MASYQRVFKVAKSKKSHTIAEERNNSYAIEIGTDITGNEARKKLELVPLSCNVIQSRVPCLSLDILEQVISHISYLTYEG